MKKTILIALMLLTSVMTFAQIPTNGLVAEYTFSGNAEDGTINDNDGLVNGATLTTDRFGNDSSAYYFDGVDDYITPGDVEYLDGKVEATWNFWLLTNTNNFSNSIVTIIGKNESYIPFEFHSQPARYRAFIWNNTTSTTTLEIGTLQSNIINDDTWGMYTLVRSKSEIKFYKNSVLLKSTPIDSTITFVNSNKPLLFAMSNIDLLSGAYNGKLDDIRIYDVALTKSEITQLYNEGNVTTGVSNNTITNNNTIVNYQVYDLSGKLIYNNSIKPLNVEFSKGIYILKSFKSDNSVVTNKFIVQ